MVKVEGVGEGDEQNRRLKLSIRWISASGTGFTSDSAGTSMHYRSRASDDAASVTITNEAGTGTFPFKMWESAWELSSPVITEVEQGPDIVTQTAAYRSRRESKLSPLDPGGFSPPLPVVEEIELIQKREMKLVPRG
jgi:hypothetical protein